MNAMNPLLRSFLVVVLLVVGFLAPAHFLGLVRSANLTNVTVTLSTPRLSFYGDLNTNNVTGSSFVQLDTTAGAAPSTSSANLFEGNSVKIGYRNYTVASSSGGLWFTTTTALQSGDANSDAAVIASRSATFDVDFTTASAVNNGSFRVLVPAATTNAANGIPDQTGWDGTGDFTNNTTVTCPSNTGNYTFGASTKSASGVTLDGRVYHSFVCPYTGTGGVGTAITNFTIAGLINPAPSATHTVGYSDTYRVIVQNLDGSNNVVDQTTSAVALIESVMVTAQVAPQITFRILGINSGVTRCGVSTSVTTTPALVPFGELLIDSFKTAAQELVVSTNASGGYVVTTVADNQLHRVGAACVGEATTGGCIPDATGDAANMTFSTPATWTSTTAKGFAYSLEENSVSADELAFVHDNGQSSPPGTCTATNNSCYKQFADNEQSQAAQTIMTSTTVADQDSFYVCYKAIISNTQQAGDDYSTGVTYRATATF